MEAAIDWLLGSDPYVQYATRLNILGQDRTSLLDLRAEVLADRRVQAYLQDVANFYDTLVSGHKNPSLPMHKLLFLLEVGLDQAVPEIASAITQISSSTLADGMPRSLANIPKHYGGTGENTLAWCLCDAPLLLAAELMAGVPYVGRVREGVQHLFALQRSNGLPCAVSAELGKFRGPGKKSDCCPYATLATLKLLALTPEYADSPQAVALVDALLALWSASREQHPYMFFMGTDFRKLKAPTVWYDIVSVADCLSQFACAREDRRFQEMLDIIVSKADDNLRFTPESIYLKCKDWDYGQKQQPSSWLTYVCLRLLLRSSRLAPVDCNPK